MQGPRLYRFFNYEQSEYLPAPTGGWNPAAHPWELPSDQAAQLDNFMIRPGKIVMRGAFAVNADATVGSLWPLSLAGAFIDRASNCWISVRSAAVSPMYDPWDVVRLSAPAANLATGSTAGQKASPVPGGAFTATTYTSKDTIPGPRAIDFYGDVYGISYDSAGAVVTDAGGNYHARPTSLYILNQAGGTNTWTACTGAPHGAFDLIGYQSRIWLLGGIDTPGALTVHEPVTLYFSNPITAGGGILAADWENPGTNKILMDGDAIDYGVGLAVVRNGLLVFRRNSVWLLRGTTTTNYALVPLSREFGCIDARSIVETDQGVYWMSDRGLMFTAGSTVSNVSGPLMYTLQEAIREVRNLNNRSITCAITSQGQIIISITKGQTVPNTTTAILTVMYDPTVSKAGAWSRITSGIFANDCVQIGGTFNNLYAGVVINGLVPGYVYSIGDRYVTSIENPFASYTFVDTNGYPGFSGALYDYNYAATNPYYAIPAMWRTGMVPITTALKRSVAQLKRYFVDYIFGGFGLVPTTGWTIQPVDATLTALDSAQSVQLDGVPVTAGWVTGATTIVLAGHGSILRFNRDLWIELTKDIMFEISWFDTGSPRLSGFVSPALAEIYGVGLEFQHSRDQRGASS